jgi:hypothetical protein
MARSAALLLILSLAISPIISVLPVNAEYSGNITIGADGSINPSTAPLKQVGNIYSLTSDVSGRIRVNNNNLVLDGNKHRVTAPSIFNYGIALNGVSNVTVVNFVITGGAIGINVNGTSNIVADNTISGTDNGIYSIQEPTAAIALHDSSSNLITGNNLESNKVGLILVSWHPKRCTNNQIVENNFKDSSTAITIYDSSNNSIYHNNFINNKILLQDNGYSGYSLPSFNIWDDGHTFGNYWSDYTIRYPYATEINATGVGDTPYFVKPNNYVDISTLSRQEAKSHWTYINAQYTKNTDHFPLMQPFKIGNYMVKTTPPKISVLSPLNQTYNETTTSLVFSLDKPLIWTGYSLDGKENVTIIGNTTIADLANGLHNVTIYANDTYGNMGVSQTISFTVDVPEPFSVVPVVAASAAVALVVVTAIAGLLLYLKKHKKEPDYDG